MFIDEAKVSLRAGDGGNGVATFRREKFIPEGGPDGGDGGNGGSVYAICSHDITDLEKYKFTPLLEAKNGKRGQSRQKTGANGESLYLKVPAGTIFIDPLTGFKVAELLEDNEEVLLLKGGRGGKGNIHFKSSTNQAPRQFTEGTLGEESEFVMVLKTIAQAGLVGFPNAGKSSLTSLISKAHPKCASYPFTTLHVNIGTIFYPELYDKITIADIPGIIEGASQNKGLGHRFLRHIERCKVLLIILDMQGTDERDPLEDYKILLSELKLYDKNLAKKNMIVLANKMDEPNAEKNLKRFNKKYPKIKICPISCLSEEGVEEFKTLLYKNVKKVEKKEQKEEEKLLG